MAQQSQDVITRLFDWTGGLGSALGNANRRLLQQEEAARAAREKANRIEADRLAQEQSERTAAQQRQDALFDLNVRAPGTQALAQAAAGLEHGRALQTMTTQANLAQGMVGTVAGNKINVDKADAKNTIDINTNLSGNRINELKAGTESQLALQGGSGLEVATGIIDAAGRNALASQGLFVGNNPANSFSQQYFDYMKGRDAGNAALARDLAEMQKPGPLQKFASALLPVADIARLVYASTLV